MSERNLQQHLSEEQLVWHYYGDGEAPEATELHLRQCRACTAEFEKLKATLAAVSDYAAPSPGPGYEERVWRRLTERDTSLAPRWHWKPIAGIAAALLLAFLAGRFTYSPKPSTEQAPTAMVREKLLAAALADHLEQSERLLMEIANAPAAALPESNRLRAEQLLPANRLYRQTAQYQGQPLLANVLEDLERVLLDTAHAGPHIRTNQEDLLFKIRVLAQRADTTLRESTAPRPATKGKS